MDALRWYWRCFRRWGAPVCPLLGCLALALLLFSAGQAQTEPVLWRIGGSLEAVAVQGDYAYLAQGNNLVVVRLTDQQVTGKLAFYYPLMDVAVEGSYAYVVTKNYGDLHVVDVSDPANPEPVGTGFLSGAEGLALRFPYAYVSGPITGDGLTVFDVSASTAPSQTAQIPGANGRWTKLGASHLYVLTKTPSLLIFDISDPAHPVQVGGAFSVAGGQNLTVVEPYVYVSGTVGFSPGVHIIDVSNPAAPKEVGNWEYAYTGDMLGVAAYGNTLYLGFNANGADPPPTIHILDISDKTDPVRTATIQPYGSLYNFLLKGAILYIAGGPDGDLSAFDLAAPLSPVQKWRLEQPGSVSKVQIAGSRAYLLAKSDYRGVQNGIWIYDISDPLSPALVDEQDPFGSVHDFDVSGGYIYISGVGVCLQVTGAAQLFPPLGSYSHEDGRCDDVEVQGGVAYVTVPGAGSVDAINVADPAAPSFAGRAVIASSPLSLGPSLADGNRLFVKSAYNQLTALNISNPLAPAKTADYQMPTVAETLNGLDIDGDTLYVATSNGMSLLDGSNLLNIQRLGTYAGYAAKSVAVQDGVAYLGGSYYIDTVNVQSPTTPASIWKYNGPAEGEAVQVLPPYLLAADADLGLSLYQIADGAVRLASGAAQSASPTASLIVTFAQPMDTSTVTYHCSPDPGGWQASWSAAAMGRQRAIGRTLTLTHNPFQVGQTYTFTVTGGYTSEGQSIEPFSLTFTTAEDSSIYLPSVLRQ